MRPETLRRIGWITLALLLLAGAGSLLSAVEERPVLPPSNPPEFPRGLRGPEAERMAKRMTLIVPAPLGPPAPAGVQGADATPTEPARRDPFLRALPARADDAVIVFEANALRHSRLGELVIGCVLERNPDVFARFERATGIDPLKDVDRVGLAGDAVVVSGFFDRARWQELERLGARPERVGEAGVIWTGSGAGARDPVLGTWRDQIVVVGPDRETVQRAIDQIEGRGPEPSAELSEAMTYGELYGFVPGQAVRKLLQGSQSQLGEKLADATQRFELHVDAMQDVAAVVRAKGDPARLGDLARTIGAALAVARVQAEATRDSELAALLEHAKVRPGGDGFDLEMAVPATRLEEWFKECAPLRGPRPQPPPTSTGDADGEPADEDGE
jgi:hypothetical protein